MLHPLNSSIIMSSAMDLVQWQTLSELLENCCSAESVREQAWQYNAYASTRLPAELYDFAKRNICTISKVKLVSFLEYQLKSNSLAKRFIQMKGRIGKAK
jgi:hypothetical protein